MLITVSRALVLLAAFWSIGASLYVSLSPVSGRGVAGRLVNGSSRIVETFITEQTWYESEGLWGIFLLVVFVAVYFVAVHLIWKNRVVALTVLSVITVILSVVSSFSIGVVFLPSALILFLGVMIMLLSRLEFSR